MTRILHLAATPNGAPWMIALVIEQKRRGHEVEVVLPSLDGTIAPILMAEGIRCHAIPLDILSARSHLARARTVAGLVRLLRRLRPDVVHSHLINTVLTARIAAAIADVPVVYSGNASPLTLESDLLRTLEVGTAFCDTRSIASCSFTRELFTRYGIPEAQCVMVPYAPEHTAFDPMRADGGRVRRELGIDADTPLIGMVAYFYARSTAAVVGKQLAGRNLKGQDVLLQAFRDVRAAVPHAKLLLVGGGWGAAGMAEMRRMEALARKLGIDDAVTFAGERRDVPDVLAALDVSVQASLIDNLGGTIESLLMERPLVVSDARGFADTVRHEETGIVVPAGDAAALAGGILRLLRDHDLGRRLGQAGRRRMLEHFTVPAAAARLDEFMAGDCARVGALAGTPRGRAARAPAGEPPALRDAFYRLGTMLRRAMAMPFRLLPLLREVRRVQRRRHGNRIVQVIGAWRANDWFVRLCSDLAERGYEVTAVIDRKPGDLAARLQDAGIPYCRVPLTFGMHFDRTRMAAYLFNVPLAALRLAWIARRSRADIMHSHIFSTVIVARIAAALARVRHVAGIPGPRHLDAALTRTIDRLTWRLDDRTLAGCRYTEERYRALGAPPLRLECVYYGADATRFDPARVDAAAARRALGIRNGAPLVALVAHFYPPARGVQVPAHTRNVGLKGHDDFLAAAAIVARSHPDARFVLAGAGVSERGEEYRQNLIARCRADELLRERVLFTGGCDDVPSLLAASDVSVQCSLTENLGGTIESLLMERPVVATRVGGMPESVRDGETGLLVPPASPEALAAAIVRLLENRDEARAFGRAGRRLMLERFTSEQTTSDIDAVYRGLTAAR